VEEKEMSDFDSQVPTVKIAMHKLIRRELFLEGYDDVKTGKVFDYSKVEAEHDNWQYERGRHFAVYLKSIGKRRMPIMKNGRPNWKMVRLLGQAFRDGALT
jgi:hypothetical protein